MLQLIASIFFIVAGITYVILSRATNKHVIVNINNAVYLFKRKPDVFPTIAGILIVLLAFIACLPYASLITYTR